MRTKLFASRVIAVAIALSHAISAHAQTDTTVRLNLAPPAQTVPSFTLNQTTAPTPTPSIPANPFGLRLESSVLADNGCAEMIRTETEMTYDVKGAEYLRNLAAARPCPVNTTLAETIKFVNELVSQAFDDSYTFVMTPEQAKEADESARGQAKAFDKPQVGLQFEEDRVHLVNSKPTFSGKIWRVFSNSPAGEAGMLETDRLVSIDGVSVLGRTQESVLNDLMGVEGSTVLLQVVRGDEIKSFKLTRKTILANPVFSKNLGDGVYAIVIQSYVQVGTADLVRAEIEKTLPFARAYVIDQRGNGGGLIDESLQTAQLFVKDGVLLTEHLRISSPVDKPVFEYVEYSVDGKLGKGRVVHKNAASGEVTAETLTERQPYLLNGRPVIVLNDERTASAAEIFAAAVKENRVGGAKGQGATILGTEKSFGKGIGQYFASGPNGTRIKATAVHLITPGGHWVGDAHNNRIGLAADIVVVDPPDTYYWSPADVEATTAKAHLIAQVHDNHEGLLSAR